MFTLGEEPIPGKSIAYHTDDPHLLPAVKAALHDDEWEELKNSRLGVFIKFWELKFGWVSRLVHYMLCYQLDIKKKYELWCLIGPEPVRFSMIEFEHLTGLNCEYIKNLDNPAVEVTDELARFLELTAVDIDAGPSSHQIVEACERSGEWSRDDRLRLGYLAIYTGFIEGKKYSSATRASPARLVMDLEDFETYPWGRLAFKTLIDSVKAKKLTKTCYTVDGFIQVLQVWVYYAMPDLAASFGKPIRNKPSPPLLAYKGHKGRKFVKEAISTQTRVVNYEQKEIDEMFPQWDNDESDVVVENLVKFMFAAKGKWKWTQECCPVEGAKKCTNPVYVKQERPQPSVNEERRAQPTVNEERKAPEKARTEAYTESPAAAARNGITREEIEQLFKDMTKVMTAGFGQCVEAVKLLGGRMEALEKKVGIKRKGTDSNELQLTLSDTGKDAKEPGSESVNGDKGGRENNVHAANIEPGCLTEPSVVIMDKTKPTKSDLEREEERREAKKDIVKEYCRAKSERERKLAASQQSPFLGNSTAKQIVPTKNVGHGYDPFAPIDKKNAKVFLEFLKKDLHHTLRFEKKPSGSRSLWFATLQTPLKWLMGYHMDGFINLLRLRYSEHPEHFRSDRLCFLDSTFGLMWIDKYGDFKSSEPGINGLGRRLPPGAFDHYAGLVPKYRQSNHIWGKYVDDIYAPVNYNNEHWIAIWVSIPKKHITI
ncbi:hypothetical protein F2Q69_00035978 [Brassica cretica]|uniref:Ubiquitin-like protease family profile domain-containing protein n=1 Tax=Brassica cretica TaxID=69181 RepID=A0A8S9SW95_BRACR|nr:hypothetical protein F2Q69_00035978 [Brassica cretica]